MGREKRKGLVAWQSGLLKASPGCLHINEQPVFSSRVGHPHTLPCLQAAHLWGLSLTFHCWESWKDLPPTLGNCPKSALSPHRATSQASAEKTER